MQSEEPSDILVIAAVFIRVYSLATHGFSLHLRRGMNFVIIPILVDNTIYIICPILAPRGRPI